MVLAAFTLIAVLVMVAGWRGRYRPFENLLRTKLHIKRISIFYLVVWAVTIVVFWGFFHEKSERWELQCLLVELAGVTFLAREVNLTQTYESINKELKDAEEEARLYPEDVQLKARLAATREKWEGEIADRLSKNRRRLLFLGVSLVALALWGHGVLAMTQPDSDVSGDSEFKDAITGLEKRLAGQGQRIADLEGEVATERRDIQTIKEENRHWHVRRRPSRQCNCAQPSAHF